MEIHRYAKIPPPLSSEDYEALREDIRAHGLKRPITIDKKRRVIDGCHRLRACEELKIDPVFETFPTDDDLVILQHVQSCLKHRHMSPGQKAVVAMDVEKAERDLAAERMRAGKSEDGKAGGRGRSKTLVKELTRVSNPTPEAERLAQQRRMHADWSEINYGVPSHTEVRERRKIQHIEPPPKPPRDHRAENERKAAGVAAAIVGVNRQYVADVKKIAANEEMGPALIEKIKTSELTVPQAKREIKKAEVKKKLTDEAEIETRAAQGVYDVIVIDPPWPMKKIERDVRPNQAEFDYTTMTEAELGALELPCAENAHVWVWTTHKFLPMALRLLSTWGLKYVCTFVWHKPGGFQPIGLPQYNCEFALYARKGSPSFLDTKAFPAAFQAPRGKHSEKPEAFYDMVRRVTGGRRLDMFNRRQIDGFDGWGKEAKA